DRGLPAAHEAAEPDAPAVRPRARRHRARRRLGGREGKAGDHGAVVPVPPRVDRAGPRPTSLLAARDEARRPAPRRGAAPLHRGGLARDVPADLDLVRRGRCRATDPYALLLVEPGELEPSLEIDALSGHLRREKDEVVRVQVAADVRLRKEPLVGRVAETLEA